MDMISNLVDNKPQATAAAAATGIFGLLSVIPVWLLGYFGANVSAEDGVIIATTTTTVLVFISHHGIKGLICRIWGGDQGT